jgi:hypothetical protein
VVKLLFEGRHDRWKKIGEVVDYWDRLFIDVNAIMSLKFVPWMSFFHFDRLGEILQATTR